MIKYNHSIISRLEELKQGIINKTMWSSNPGRCDSIGRHKSEAKIDAEVKQLTKRLSKKAIRSQKA
ncbi:MAG: hypothetical protein ABI840_13170 [bacterium]